LSAQSVASPPYNDCCKHPRGGFIRICESLFAPRGRSGAAAPVRPQKNSRWTAAAGRSDLVRLALRLIVEEALEGEVSDGRERYERGEGEKAGYRNGYRPGKVKTAEGEHAIVYLFVDGIAELACPSSIRWISAPG
jgi:hypothetical protein